MKEITVREHERVGTDGVKEHIRTLPNVSMGQSKGNFEENAKSFFSNQQDSFHLPLELSLYVPSTQDKDKPISKSQFDARINEAELFLSKLFGGKTTIQATGGYAIGDKLIEEDVVKVTSFSTTEDFSTKKRQFIRQVRIWKDLWSQDSMGVEFEGDLFYI